LNGALTGVIVVERSERPIKSLELQLIRMESIAADEIKGKKVTSFKKYASSIIVCFKFEGPGRNKEISEVQNIQVSSDHHFINAKTTKIFERNRHEQF
jgi:hypothetical protein